LSRPECENQRNGWTGRYYAQRRMCIPKSARAPSLRLSHRNCLQPCSEGSKAGRLLPPGTVLVTCIGNLGKTAIVRRNAIANQQINAILPTKAASPEFLFYWVKTIKQWLEENSSATTVTIINKRRFSNAPIALPPPPEQRQIVAKLDSLTGRTARAGEDLEKIPRLIQKYREAILAAAFNGNLTRDWRSQLVPEAHTGGWTQSALGALAQAGPTNGWSPPSTREGNGALTLKLTATTSGYMRLDSESTKRIHDTPPPDSKFWLREGDLLIQRGTTIDYVGTVAIYDGPPNTYIYPDLMMRVRFSSPELTRYVWRNSPAARAFFRSRATGTAGNMPKINGAIVRGLMIPLPPLAEMTEILRRIETAFAWLDRVTAEHAHASRLLPKLDQAKHDRDQKKPGGDERSYQPGPTQSKHPAALPNRSRTVLGDRRSPTSFSLRLLSGSLFGGLSSAFSRLA
jgi:type I restriction enzyme, S subunit